MRGNKFWVIPKFRLSAGSTSAGCPDSTCCPLATSLMHAHTRSYTRSRETKPVFLGCCAALLFCMLGERSQAGDLMLRLWSHDRQNDLAFFSPRHLERDETQESWDARLLCILHLCVYSASGDFLLKHADLRSLKSLRRVLQLAQGGWSGQGATHSSTFIKNIKGTLEWTIHAGGGAPVTMTVTMTTRFTLSYYPRMWGCAASVLVADASAQLPLAQVRSARGHNVDYNICPKHSRLLSEQTNSA